MSSSINCRFDVDRKRLIRELNLALSHELGYRGDVREGLQEQREMDEAMEAREVPEFGATSSRGHDDVEEEPAEMEPRRRNRWHWDEEGDDGSKAWQCRAFMNSVSDSSACDCMRQVWGLVR